ncbi:MAG: FMN-binding protein [Lachnospiraceae bacterium]|nr:FMN-binding protein [Lachnospiraceae bacterium]
MKKILIIASIVLGVIFIGFAALIGGGFLMLKNKMTDEVNAFDKTPIEINSVADGTYEGTAETTLVKVKVSVTVNDGEIENIEILKHECGKGAPANVIVNDMMLLNNIEVDAVTGATYSSEVIKAAVRNALR